MVTNEHLVSTLEDVVEDVFELMLFANAMPADEEVEEEAANEPMIIATIGLVSPLKGTLVIGVSEEVVRGWCDDVQFDGCEDPEGGLLAELSNTLAGCLQSAIARPEETVSVGTPDLSREENWQAEDGNVTSIFDVDPGRVAVAIALEPTGT